MHPDRDFDATLPTPKAAIPYAQDLELEVLLHAATGQDVFLREVMHTAFFHAWENDFATVQYRQGVLKDCLANVAIVRQLYAMATEPFERENSWDYGLYGFTGQDASSMVSNRRRG